MQAGKVWCCSRGSVQKAGRVGMDERGFGNAVQMFEAYICLWKRFWGNAPVNWGNYNPDSSGKKPLCMWIWVIWLKYTVQHICTQADPKSKTQSHFLPCENSSSVKSSAKYSSLKYDKMEFCFESWKNKTLTSSREMVFRPIWWPSHTVAPVPYSGWRHQRLVANMSFFTSLSLSRASFSMPIIYFPAP